MMKRTLTGLLALGVASWAAFANDLVGIRIQEASHAEDDGQRLALLRELAAEPGLDSALKSDLARMTHEIGLYRECRLIVTATGHSGE